MQSPLRGFWAVGVIAVVSAALLFWRFLPTTHLSPVTSSQETLGDLTLPTPPALPSSAPAPDRPAEVVVHVAGAVNKPGVVRLPAGSRVDDAVKAAGGFSAEADPDSVNLAQPLEDGVQVYVPRRSQPAQATVQNGFEPSRPAPTQRTPSAVQSPTDGKINLNTATAEQLESLPGIGPVTARAIIEYRQQNGGFRSVDELIEVRGIGPKRLEQIRPYVVVR